MSDDRLCKLKEILRDAEDFGHFVRSGDSQIEDVPEKLRVLWKNLEESATEISDHKNDQAQSDSFAVQPSSSMQEFLTELKIIETTCGYLGQYTRRIQFHTFTKFSPSDYAVKLLAKFSTDDDDDHYDKIDWMQMSSNAVRIVNRAPGIPILGGTFNDRALVSPDMMKKGKKRTILQATLEEENTEKQIPDKVQKIEEDRNSVDKKVKLIQKLLHVCYTRNEKQPVSFFKFILHPTDFTATVENIFHLCFMIRDGLVRLDIIDDDLVIEPTMNSQHDNEVSVEKHQMLFSITFDDWKNLVETYNISEPIIQ